MNAARGFSKLHVSVYETIQDDELLLLLVPLPRLLPPPLFISMRCPKMDAPDPWLESLLRVLPNPYLAALHDHILNPHSPLQDIKRTLLARAERTLNTVVYPLAMPFITRLTSLIHSSPDIVFFAAVLSVLYLAFVAVLWLRRIMLFWMRLAFRLAGWSLVALLVAAAWQRGLEQSTQDVFAAAMRVMGYAAVVRDVWMREYERYQEQERMGGARGRGRGR